MEEHPPRELKVQIINAIVRSDAKTILWANKFCIDKVGREGLALVHRPDSELDDEPYPQYDGTLVEHAGQEELAAVDTESSQVVDGLQGVHRAAGSIQDAL